MDLSFPPYLHDDIPTFEKSPDYFTVNNELLLGRPKDGEMPKDRSFVTLMKLKVDLDSIYLKFILVQQSPNPILAMDDYTIEEWTLLLQKSNQPLLYKKQRQILFLLRQQLNKKVAEYRPLKLIKQKYGTTLFNLIIKFHNEYSKDNEFEPKLFLPNRKLSDQEYSSIIDPNRNIFWSQENLGQRLGQNLDSSQENLDSSQEREKSDLAKIGGEDYWEWEAGRGGGVRE